MRLRQVIPNKLLTVGLEEEELLTGSVFVGEVTSLPGCADIAVSHAMQCLIGKGRGNAHAALRMREAQLRELGYCAMVCTVVEDNVAQQKVLSMGGYKVTLEFFNKRTGNMVRMWSKAL